MKQLFEVQCPSMKGKKLIENSDLFSWIDRDFAEYGANKPGGKTEAQTLEVLEIDKDGTFDDYFNKNQVLSQEQIIWFVRKHKDKLRDNGTFFLFKSGDDFFVADVRVDSFGLFVRVGRFENSSVWHADDRHRVVVPQLSLKNSEQSLKLFDPLELKIEYSGIKYKLVKE